MSELVERYLGNPKLAARLPALANMVLIILITYTLAGIVWQFVLSGPRFALEEAAPPPSAAPGPTNRVTRTAPDTTIVQAHLFGTAAAPEVVSAAQAPEAPETRLNLTLTGVYATGEGHNALAIVASGGRTEQFYRVGDSVAGGATLKAVYPDRIILERNGRLETLRLPKGREDGFDIKQSGPEPGSPRSVAPASDPGRLAALRQYIVEHPQSLQTMMEATPAREADRFVGYRLRMGNDTRLFEQFGLQTGDIVTQLNGVELDRPRKGLTALKALAKADAIDITLLRDGQPLTLEHSLVP